MLFATEPSGLSQPGKGFRQLRVNSLPTEPNGFIAFDQWEKIADGRGLAGVGYLRKNIEHCHVFIGFVLPGFVALSTAAADAPRHLFRRLFYAFDADITQPVGREIVGVGKAVADVKTKVMNKHLPCVVGKSHAPVVGDAIVLPVDVEAVQLLVVPAHGDLNDMMQVGQ